MRIRAPELRAAGGWLNTAGPLSLADLRGKIVLLDFWTSGCANCMHVIDELRPLEEKYADVLVVIGVHSPKFVHETELSAVAAAIDRYGVRHPVLSDPDMALWQQYAVRAWPTLVLIDPDGYVVAQAAGEGQVSGLDRIISSLIENHASTIRRGGEVYLPAKAADSVLRLPSKVLALPASLLVSDTAHHQIVKLSLDGATVLRRIGSGQRGRIDGAAPSFAEPNGLALLPRDVASHVGFDVVVADTANHVLRGLRLADGAVLTTIDLPALLQGTSTITGPVPAVLSPWDVAWWPALSRLVIAAAGVHLLLSWDPISGAVELLAGTTVEGRRDGPALDGWLAQPSGLAVDGDRLWFVDAESSALRWLSADGTLQTAVGDGLFDFGHVDGPAEKARLQHPLGVALLPDGSLAVADTYNGAVRRYAPERGEVSTIAAGLAEPSDAVVVGGSLLVVESAANQLTWLDLGTNEEIDDGELHTQRPVTAVASGVELSVSFTPPPGRKLDDRYGPSTRLSVSASPASLLLDGGGDGTELRRTLRLAESGEGVLTVIAQAAACDDDPAVEHPACYVSRQDWGVPIRVSASGTQTLTLPLLG